MSQNLIALRGCLAEIEKARDETLALIAMEQDLALEAKITSIVTRIFNEGIKRLTMQTIDCQAEVAQAKPAEKPKMKEKANGSEKAGKGVASKAFPVYCLNDDPTQTYTRGVMPNWMKDQILKRGLDPAKAEDRATFKAKFMTVLAS